MGVSLSVAARSARWGMWGPPLVFVILGWFTAPMTVAVRPPETTVVFDATRSVQFATNGPTVVAGFDSGREPDVSAPEVQVLLQGRDLDGRAALAVAPVSWAVGLLAVTGCGGVGPWRRLERSSRRGLVSVVAVVGALGAPHLAVWLAAPLVDLRVPSGVLQPGGGGVVAAALLAAVAVLARSRPTPLNEGRTAPPAR